MHCYVKYDNTNRNRTIDKFLLISNVSVQTECETAVHHDTVIARAAQLIEFLIAITIMDATIT